MNFKTKPAIQFTAAAALALALTACASKPKPVIETAPPPPPPPADTFTAPAPEPVDQSGAPRPGTTQDFVINVGDTVYFEFDSYQVRDDARPILDGQAAWLSRYPAVRVRIEGNADERGTREYNMALGARRANAVLDYLSSRGVSPSRISTVSYGKERPIDPGSNESAWSRNRNAKTTITEGAR